MKGFFRLWYILDNVKRPGDGGRTVSGFCAAALETPFTLYQFFSFPAPDGTGGLTGTGEGPEDPDRRRL